MIVKRFKDKVRQALSYYYDVKQKIPHYTPQNPHKPVNKSIANAKPKLTRK